MVRRTLAKLLPGPKEGSDVRAMPGPVNTALTGVLLAESAILSRARYPWTFSHRDGEENMTSDVLNYPDRDLFLSDSRLAEYRGKSALVTGGLGFIPSNVVHALTLLGCSVHGHRYASAGAAATASTSVASRTR